MACGSCGAKKPALATVKKPALQTIKVSEIIKAPNVKSATNGKG
jgi:hypothetical protein